MSKRRALLINGGALALQNVAAAAVAQVATEAPAPVAGARPVTLQRIKVHSPAIAGNLSGESADRDVIVVLPPSYGKEPKRYPVVYALHGYSIGPEQWIKEIRVPQTAEGAFAKGGEMILVFPDSKNAYNGSMYSSSPTTGDFERFITEDLIHYVDSHFRTLARRESRGLVGHSMGGYGAARLSLKHPDLYGAVYMMSPCCLSAREAGPTDATTLASIAALRSPQESSKLPFIVRAQLAVGAAWSPNPKRPPLYLDVPGTEGVSQADILAKWSANAPLAMLDQYVGEMRRYRAIAIDVGDRDGLKTDALRLHERLESYGIANSFDLYQGDHTNRVAFRFQDYVLPFFAKNLSFDAKR